MNEETKIQYRSVVERIFSNWAGLEMAVENSMAGPNSIEMVQQIIDHMCNYCFSVPDVDMSELCEELEDILDEEFNTICEDNSPKEVSQVMWNFFQALKQGNMELFIAESNKLPQTKTWLTQPQSVRVQRTIESSDEEEEEEEKTSSGGASMDVDPEWTVVTRSRRKK